MNRIGTTKTNEFHINNVVIYSYKIFEDLNKIHNQSLSVMTKKSADISICTGVSYNNRTRSFSKVTGQLDLIGSNVKVIYSD